MNQNMKASENAVELIKQFEGLRLKTYLCPSNVLTIGWGHTGDDVSPEMEITEAKAEEFLRLDMAKFEEAINRLVKVPMKQNQFDALVSFVFNVGEAQFAKSTLIKVLNGGHYSLVPEQLKRWNKGGGPLKVLPGMVARRKAESELWNKE